MIGRYRSKLTLTRLDLSHLKLLKSGKILFSIYLGDPAWFADVCARQDVDIGTFEVQSVSNCKNVLVGVFLKEEVLKKSNKVGREAGIRYSQLA